MVRKEKQRRAVRGGIWWLGASGAAALCLMLAAVGQAQAPAAKFKEMKVNPPDNPRMRNWVGATHAPGAAAKQMLQGNIPFVVADFDSFFNELLFPQFTLPENITYTPADPKDLQAQKWGGSLLPLCRDEFMKQFIGQGHEKVAFDRLNQLTLTAMEEIALHDYHPLSRYQAATILSQLYAYSSPPSPSTPLPGALPVLMRCLDSIDVVQIPALKGILWHVKNGELEATQQQAILAAMLKIASQKTPPEGRTPDGHDWIRRQAIEVLAALGTPGAKAEVLTTLTAILNDNQSSPRLTCAAAEALGSIKFRAPESINLSAAAFSIARAALDDTAAELTAADERQADVPPPTAGAGAGVGPGQRLLPGQLPGAAPDVAPAPVKQTFFSTRLVKSQLVALEHGLRGTGKDHGLLNAASGTKDQAFMQSVDEKLTPLIAACDGTVTDYDKLKAEIVKAGADLESLLAANNSIPGRQPSPIAGKVSPFGGAAGRGAAGKGSGGAGADAANPFDETKPAGK